MDTLRHKFACDVTIRQAISCGHWLLQGWGASATTYPCCIWSVWPHPYCCSNRSRAVQPDLTKYSGIWATMGGWDVFSGFWKHLQQPNASKLYGNTTAHLGNIVLWGMPFDFPMNTGKIMFAATQFEDIRVEFDPKRNTNQHPPPVRSMADGFQCLDPCNQPIIRGGCWHPDLCSPLASDKSRAAFLHRLFQGVQYKPKSPD